MAIYRGSSVTISGSKVTASGEATFTGGTIDNTPIGSITPSTGVFTNLVSTGNAALNVDTPQTIPTTSTAIQLGARGIIEARVADIAGYVDVLHNAVWDGSTYRYISTDPASGYELYNGGIFLRVVGSGTAGDPFSFTDAMQITNNANVIVGGMSETTAAAGVLHLANATAPTGNASGGGALYAASGALKYLGTSGTAVTLANADGTAVDGLWTKTGDDIYYDVTGGGVLLGHSSPNAWHTGWQYMEVGKWCSISGSDSTGVADFARNYYNATDNTDTRIDAGYAQAVHLEPANGYIQLRVAASGAADSAITWIDALNIGPTGIIYGDAIKDEDTMSSNSAFHLASQQSIKAYVDNQNQKVTTTALEDITNAINTDALKVQGFQVYNTTTDKPVWAVGNTDGAVWVDATGATAHTPV